MPKKPAGFDEPRIDDPAPDDLDDASAELLGARQTHEAERFDGGDLTGYDLEGSRFTECVLDRVTLTGAKLRGSRVIDTVLVEPFAPELKASRTYWRSVRFERPRWGSAELFDSELESVRITGGKIDFLNLRGSTLTDVVIEGCSITELDLGGATATRVALIDCRLGTLDVTAARLSSLDLRGATFDRIDGVDDLGGAVIDDYQLQLLAPLFADRIGVMVR